MKSRPLCWLTFTFLQSHCSVLWIMRCLAVENRCSQSKHDASLLLKKTKSVPSTLFFLHKLRQHLIGICKSRSKLAFARGTPSDSIAFVNAFKVKCLLSSCSAQGNYMCVYWLMSLKPFCIVPGMALIQNEGTAETPKGEPNKKQTYKYMLILFFLQHRKMHTAVVQNHPFKLQLFFLNYLYDWHKLTALYLTEQWWKVDVMSLVCIYLNCTWKLSLFLCCFLLRTNWTGEKRTSFRSRGSGRYSSWRHITGRQFHPS